MEISKAAVACVVGACIAAGAGGAYLATRDAAPAVVVAARGADVLGAARDVTVEHSEQLVSETTVPAAPRLAPPPPERPARETAAPARRAAPQPTEERRIAPVVERADRTAAALPPVTEDRAGAPLEPLRIFDNQASRAVEPVGPLYDDLVVAADSVIGVEIETSVTSERARVEDQVVARVTRDVRVGNRVAIPAGSRVHGEVTLVERGGRLKERARLGVRFTSVVLADGTRMPIQTGTIYREGDAPGGESAAKIGGGAIGGAIIGGILGGAKGAAIGGAVGAGGGTAAVLAGGRNAATLPTGTPVTVRVEDPVVVTVER